VAEEQDASKTEEPTSKRLEQAREKGQVAVSQEFKSWLILLGGATALVFLAPGVMNDLAARLVRFVEAPDAMTLRAEDAQTAFAGMLLEIGWVIAPIIGLLLLLAIAGGYVQVGPIWAPSKIKPELNKISLIKGFQRLFSLQSFVEFLKGLLKLSVVAAVGLGLSLPLLEDLELIPMFQVMQTLDRIHQVAIMTTGGTVAVMTAVAILDFMYQKHSFLKRMRMTKQEVKDEHKQSEGDPQIKARIRRLRMERAQKRMMAEVPKADVIITNPTHFAVALKYEMETMNAPKLVAKGADAVAHRIREVAGEHDVPVVENPPLARALYASVDLDQEIPQEHYQAVAEVIGYVMRINGKMPQHQGQ
jgi:flagellar biosynthetic protein FlhB